MTEYRITWHQYRYFPYERELARREAGALLDLQDFAERSDGLLVPPETCVESVRRLTYFAGLKNGHDVLTTTQRDLEAAANARGRQSTRYSVHGLHEYKGKFNPQIAKALLNIFSVGPGSRVLDPFCGSGTTLVEAVQMGADGAGTDLNPFAIFLANAKQLALRTPADALTKTLSKLEARLRPRPKSIPGRADNERLAYLQLWFNDRQLVDIEHVRLSILNACGADAPIFLAVASDLLRDYSLQDPNDLRIRRRKDAPPSEPYQQAFLERARDVLARVGAAQTVLGGKIGFGEARLADNTKLSTKSFGCKFDCAVTSPPYAMALPYIDTQRLSLVWLGLSDPNAIMTLESSLIGSREMRGTVKREIEDALRTNPFNLPLEQLKFCRALAAALTEKDGFRRQAVPLLLYRYFGAMRQAFVGVKKAMKKGAPFALVVGHNHTTLGGVRFDIDTPRHLADLAVDAGWSLDELLPLQTYQRYGYHAANAVRAEALILLRSA